MFVESRELQPDSIVSGDICIIGSGAAGMTIARELMGTQNRVIVLESGGNEEQDEITDLARGKNIGRKYHGLHRARSRFFGGSTNCWAGLCAPLDPIDFEQREWLAHSGWPFDRATLDPYYERAQEHLHLGSYDYTSTSWEEEGAAFDFGPDAPLMSAVFQGALGARRMGKVFRKEFDRAKDVTVYLHANRYKSWGYLRVKPEVLHREQMVNVHSVVFDYEQRTRKIKHAREYPLLDAMTPVLADTDGNRGQPADVPEQALHFTFGTPSESAPNPESRVMLSTNSEDAFGVPRLELQWKLSPIDKRSIRRMHELMAESFGRAGLGRMYLTLTDDDEQWPPQMYGGWHHMGTTRMHDDPKQGVCDANGYVHGVANLLVAGSSLFPTSGAANPTSAWPITSEASSSEQQLDAYSARGAAPARRPDREWSRDRSGRLQAAFGRGCGRGHAQPS